MNEHEAGELLALYRVIFKPAGLPNRDDPEAARWRREYAEAFKEYKFEDVADAARELARVTEWAPHIAALLPVLEQKQGLKGKPNVEYRDFVIETPDGAAAVYQIAKAPDGSLEIPKGVRKLATRRELIRQHVITTADLERMAEAGTLTAEEFISERDAEGRFIGEKKLDYYTIAPERIYRAFERHARSPKIARMTHENLETDKLPIYDFYERLTDDFKL